MNFAIIIIRTVSILRLHKALVVQRIAREIPVLKMGVRFPPRALSSDVKKSLKRWKSLILKDKRMF